MTPNKIRLLYVLYIVSVTAFFIYWLFPDNAVRNYLNFRLKSVNPDFNLTAVRTKPAFPPGLKFENLNIFHKTLPLIDMTELKIEPALRSLFTPEKTFFFQGDLYDGTIKGRLNSVSKVSGDAVVMNSTLAGIQIGRSAALERLTNRKISGMLSGTLQFESSKGSAGTAAAELNLSDLRVEILASLLGIDHLAFKDMFAAVTIEGKTVRFQTCTFRGTQMDGKLNGMVELKEPFNKSVLNLSGSVRPHHQFLADLRKRLPVNLFTKKRADTNEYPFLISGTLDSPEYSIN